jgi:hypothetical protein
MIDATSPANRRACAAPKTRTSMRNRLILAAVTLIGLVEAASGTPGPFGDDVSVRTPSIFAPVSTPAFAIRDLSWFVLGICAIIFVVVSGVLAYSLDHFRRLGEAGHRMRVPIEVQPYASGVKGGIVGGVAMAVVALIYGMLAHGSLWYPINLLAGLALPGMEHLSGEQLRAFSLSALIIAAPSHGVVSLLTGLLYAVILPMLPRRHMLWGGVVAPLLWTGLIWAVLGVVNPALNARIDWLWFIASQIAFGLAAGFVISRAEPIGTMQTWPLAARAGVEATGMDRGGGHER